MARRAKGNLPAEITSFVGRRAELAGVKRMLEASRLVTLTGPGGVGKTRLGQRAAESVHRAFADGVWLVELADVPDADLVPPSIAAALGLRIDTTTPLQDLVDYLRDKQVLLVIDNCEHLVDACADVVNSLLVATHEVRVLATSREVLGVAGEQVLPVPPLPVPSENPDDQGGQGVDAMELLVERVAAANPQFAVTDANRTVLAAICRRLEGIPLAVELAALRFRVFSPEKILRRLDDTMRLLSAGPRTAPRRQQTIDAAIGWSYDLCSPDEQHLWEQLSVFSGGFDLDAAEAVCVVTTNISVADTVAGLVEKSVISLRYSEEGGGRYSILEPLRQFAAERLTARGDSDALRQRHCDHYQQLAMRGHVASWGPDDVTWFHETTREHANIRAALRFSLDQGDQHRALEIAGALRPFWEHCGFLLEGYRWLRQALEPDREPTAARARALSACAFLALLLSETEAAAELIRDCSDLAEDLALRDVLAETSLHLALLALTESGPSRAIDLAGEAEKQALTCGHLGLAAESAAFGFMCAFITDDPRADDAAARFLEMTTDHGSHLLRGLALWAVGLSRWRAGRAEAAVTVIRESIELLRLLPRSVLVASGFDGLAWAHAALGDQDRAARLMGAAHALRRRSTMRLAHAMTQVVGDRVQSEVQQALGEKPFHTAFDAGAALGLDQAIDYALGKASAEPELSTARDVLTRRELDVARLVAGGHSNRRIAAELVISIRTAETHVEHILTKLGFHSRSQIAAWVREHDV